MPRSGCERECIAECDFDVDVDIFTKPFVCQPRLDDCLVDFDVELDVKPKCKSCRVTQARHKENKEECTSGCIFNVELAFEVDARTICHPCRPVTCPTKVDVQVPFHAKCRLDKRCEEREERKERKEKKYYKYSKKSSSKSHDNCEICRRQKKRRHY